MLIAKTASGLRRIRSLRLPGGAALAAAGLAVTLAVNSAATLTSCTKADGPSRPTIEADMPIVLILIDAMRADRLSTDVGEHSTTPNLARLARDGVVFRNAFASAPKTIPSVPQIFTSRYFPDVQHSVTLMSVCKDAGYARTAAFIHNPYVKKWLARVEPTFDDLGGGDFDAARLTDDAIAWLQKRPSDRIALYVHYLDVHVPLRPPAEVVARFVDPSYVGPIGLEFGDMKGAWAGRYDSDDQRRIGQIYDATVAATDIHVGRLLDALRAGGLYDRALVVVTADHGEELWDHGGFFHGHSLYDELLRVPLVVKFPGNWHAGTVEGALASTLDILPTVTDLLGRSGDPPDRSLDSLHGSADPPHGSFDPARDSASGTSREIPQGGGRSLVSVASGASGASTSRTLFATVGRIDDRSPPLFAVRTDAAKLIYDVRDGSEMLFDLVHDAAEKVNIAAAATSGPLLDSLRGELARHWKDLHETGLHARLANRSAGPVHYKLDIGVEPFAPFANLARFDMETSDRIVQRSDSAGLTVEGMLEPGDEDEVRCDVLRTDGAINSTLTTRETGVPIEVCAGDQPCAKGGQGWVKLPMDRLQTTARPVAGRSESLQLAWWQTPGETEPLVPYLTPADRERLRALGYAE